MKNNKRFLCMILAALMVLSMAACGSEPAPAETQAPADTAPQAQVEPADPFGKYSDPVTITTVASQSNNIKFDGDDTWENNHHTRMIKNRLNIEVKYDWVADVSQYNTRLSTMLASNTMPDYFKVTPDIFAELADAEALMDVGQIYEQYASDEFKRQMDSVPEIYDSSFRNGKMYGIPLMGYGMLSAPNLFWIRQDWLDKCGLEVPQSLEELRAAAVAFKENCGAAYGIGFTKDITNTSAFTALPFMNAYHAYGATWFEKDGQLVYGSVQPEMKGALLELQSWYKDGLIDPEFAVKDTDKAAEGVISGKCGILAGANWMGFDFLNHNVENDPEAEWITVAIPSVDDDPVFYQVPWIGSGFYVINKDCKHPEAVIKMINLYMEQDAAGVISKIEMEKGEKPSINPGYQTPPTREYDANPLLLEALDTGDTSKLNDVLLIQYDNMRTWIDSRDPDGFGRYVQQTQAYPMLRSVIDEKRIIVDALQGVVPEGYVRVKSVLDQLEDETFVKIIMGEDISAFDEFVESWHKLGGDDAIAEVNEIFGK